MVCSRFFYTIHKLASIELPSVKIADDEIRLLIFDYLEGGLVICRMRDRVSAAEKHAGDLHDAQQIFVHDEDSFLCFRLHLPPAPVD